MPSRPSSFLTSSSPAAAVAHHRQRGEQLGLLVDRIPLVDRAAALADVRVGPRRSAGARRCPRRRPCRCRTRGRSARSSGRAARRSGRAGRPRCSGSAARSCSSTRWWPCSRPAPCRSSTSARRGGGCGTRPRRSSPPCGPCRCRRTGRPRSRGTTRSGGTRRWRPGPGRRSTPRPARPCGRCRPGSGPSCASGRCGCMFSGSPALAGWWRSRTSIDRLLRRRAPAAAGSAPAVYSASRRAGSAAHRRSR